MVSVVAVVVVVAAAAAVVVVVVVVVNVVVVAGRVLLDQQVPRYRLNKVMFTRYKIYFEAVLGSI